MYTLKDFRSDQPPPRPIGTEYELVTPLEFGIHFMTQEDVARAEFPNIRFGNRAWLRNGILSYKDAGETWEVCTPEDLGPEASTLGAAAAIATAGAITQSNAAKEAYNSQLRKAAKPESKTGPHVYLTAGNYFPMLGDPEPVYAHRAVNLNLQTFELEERGVFTCQNLLDAHWSTALWAGAGILTPNGFRLLQRDIHLRHNSQREITRIKANEGTVAGPQIRVERRIGEANRSVEVIFAEHASASLVLRIYEHQHRFSKKANLKLLESLPKEPLEALPHLSSDLSFTHKIPCRDDKERTWVEIQRILIGRARELSGKVQLDPAELRGLDQWEHLVNLMASCDLTGGDLGEALIGPSKHFHWAVRMRHLQRHVKEPEKPQEWSVNEPGLNELSLAIDRIAQVDPLGKFALRTGESVIPGFAERLKERMAMPGEGRSRARGELIALALGDMISIQTLGWNNFMLGDGSKYELNDPHSSELPDGVIPAGRGR